SGSAWSRVRINLTIAHYAPEQRNDKHHLRFNGWPHHHDSPIPHSGPRLFPIAILCLGSDNCDMFATVLTVLQINSSLHEGICHSPSSLLTVPRRLCGKVNL